jgi:SAM-dependent methyltransferase
MLEVVERSRAYTPEDAERFRLWYWSLKLPGRTLEQTLAEEVALYFGKSVDEVVDFWYTSTERLTEEWLTQKPQNEVEITHYYNTNTTYIYELSYWHTLHMNLGLIENVRSLQKALEAPGRKYLDFGGGIGANSILFNAHGFDTTLADISSSLLDFARWRFERRQVKATIIDTKVERLPPEKFDFVTAVEVLEHVTNPVAVMQTIMNATKPGGIIVAWVPFVEDPLRPMHIVTDMNVAERFVSELGLEEIWREDGMLIRYYRKPI